MPEMGDACELIKSSHNIAVLTHQKPDGDAVGSLLALTLALNLMGKMVRPCLVDEVAQAYQFLPGIKLIEKKLPEQSDLVIVVDASNLSRTGWQGLADDFFENKKLLVIDHHVTNENFGDVNIVDAQASSAGELVYDLLKELGAAIDKNIATCLLTCISTDTGSFQFSNTSERVLKMAAELVLAGGRLAKISENIYNRKTLPQLRLWGKVLAGLRRDNELKINVAVVTMADLKECGATDDDLEGVVSLLNTVPETRATFLVTERGEEIKGSIRTESAEVNVAEMAKLWGGGGHVKAAGFNVSGHLHRISDHSGLRWELD
jgi:phosphoesterase RecJ-like protein